MGLLFLICFFAEALFLSEASMEQMKILRDCLKDFCGASGYHVSLEKSHLLVSHNIHYNVAR